MMKTNERSFFFLIFIFSYITSRWSVDVCDASSPPILVDHQQLMYMYARAYIQYKHCSNERLWWDERQIKTKTEM